MKRTLCLIIASLAWPALAQSDPSSAVPSPTSIEANPFNDSVSVTLTAGGNADIRWDYGTTSTLMTETDGKPYDPLTPIVIKSTGILRTIAIFNGMGQPSMPANYPYVKNIKPTVAFTSPTLNQGYRPGQTVSLKATVTDTGGPQPLTVHFYRMNGSTRVELAGSPLISAPYSLDWALDAGAPIGVIPLRAVVTDGKGLSDSASVSIVISANKAPTVTLSPGTGSTFLAPATVTLIATPADQDGSITRVAFYKGADSLGEATSAPWTLAPAISLTEGTYALKAIAYDNGLPIASGTAISNVIVSKNNPPKISLAINAPAGGGKVYYAPYAARITATASDSDGGLTDVKFYTGATLDTTDLTSPWGYSKTFPAGHYSLTAKATDAYGLSTTSDSLAFTVVANQKPVAKTAADTGTIFSPTTTFQLNGSGSADPEGTTLKYKWSGPSGVTFSNDTLANPIATFPANNFNSFAIQLKVTDRGEPPLSDSMKQTIKVWDKPKITSATTAGGAANQNFTYVLTGTGFPAPTLGATSNATWLTYNAATATLSGKPPAQGTFTANLTAQSLAGSDAKTLTITIGDSLYKPSITNNPLTATGKVGTAFSYSITARGNPSNFTYAVSGLPQGLSLSGATIGGMPTNNGNYTVSMTVTNSLGSDQKNLALTINEDPRLTRDLPDTVPTVFEKSSVTFSVQASGFPAVSYQWQFSQSASANFTPVGTGNSATYTINPTSTANTGYYRVIVKNSVGEVTSKVCRLKVNPAPAPVKISQAPTAQTAVVGDRVLFKAKATGEPAPLTYRWYRGIPPARTPVTAGAANDSILILDPAQVAMNDVYSVRVTSPNFPGDTANAAYFAWSDTARLTVQLPKLAMPQANPPERSIFTATPVTLTVQVGTASIWYTLNGQDPVEGAPSFLYQGPITIDTTRTLKAKAFAPSYRPSDVMTATYNFTAPNKLAKPVILPLDSTFYGSQTIFITASDGAEIYYSLESKDTTIANRKYSDSLVIKTSTIIKAVATRTGYLASDTAMRKYELAIPKTSVRDPEFSPDGGSFTGSLIVKIASPTPGAIVHFTDDGTDPDSTKPVVTERGIQISKSTTLKAIGVLKDYSNSAIVTREFRLGPGIITASPAGDTVFDDVVNVKLSVPPAAAVIRYTLDGSTPTEESPLYPPEGKSFSTTVTISAIAYLAGQAGNLQTFSYTRKGGPLITPIPSTPGNAFTFKTSIQVSLKSTPGVKIYYTTDGSEPSFIASNLYLQPIALENTTTIQAVAVADGFENSKVLVVTYTLIPEKPVISPPGGSYPMPFNAQITSSSRKAAIYYTLNGTAPTPETGTLYTRFTDIRIDSAGSLRAIAVAGNMASEIATEEYGAIRFIDTVLVPGKTLFLYGGYTLRNPEDQSASVLVQTRTPLIPGLTGFTGVQYTLNLALQTPSGAQAQAFPKLAFTTPVSDKRSLYKVEPSGRIFFVSSGDSVTLGAGTWFMGNDTLPPTVRYVGETFVDFDSTRVTFEVKDNVANLGYNLVRNDDPSKNISGAFLFSDQAIIAQLKHSEGTVKPLFVQMSVSDFRQTAYFPADKSAFLPLSQKLKPLQGPPAWKIGVRQENRYDFISVPLALDPPLTLQGLRGLNPTALIEGAEFQNSDLKFHPMAAETPMQPGKGYWIAAHAPVTSLRMPEAATVSSGGKTAYSVALRKGWNQISNPHLETLYWPSARFLENYRSQFVKEPWGWDPMLPKPDYVRSDSLLPWRGYFVYNWGGDTVIQFLPRRASPPPSTPPATQAAGKFASTGRIQLSLGWNPEPTLSLGADRFSADGYGVEDEVALPPQGSRFLRAIRNGRGLSSDWVRLEGQKAQTWQIQFGSDGDSLPYLHIPEVQLPQGYEAWAVSDSRGMKFPLASGDSIPASGLEKDSLRVLAGPKEVLAGLLDGLSLTAPRLDAKLTEAADGFRLRVGLPSRARIRATLWSLQGSRLGTLSTGLLSEGNYEFGFAGDFGNRPARLGPGMYVLTVDVRGKDLSVRLSRKLFRTR